MKLTAEQEAAIGARGRVIVSASAGSGKTFVMIERLVSLILGGADVRRALAVTFTNKAAGQMRDRLRSALIKKLSSCGEEERTRLKEQLSALPLADICTIHSFCSRLVRTHFYLADVDPAFRVISPDDHEGAALFSRALDELFERCYEEKDEQFYSLLSVYFRSKKDAKLRKIVGELYHAVRGKADYLSLLRDMGKEDEFEDVCEYLAENVRERAREIAERAREGAEYFAGNEGAKEYCAQIARAAEELVRGGLFELAAREQPRIRNAPRASSVEGEELSVLLRMKKLCEGVKELYKSLRFSSREEEHERYLGALKISSALGSLLLRFDAIYADLKKEAGALDYDDLEHCALAVLENEEARASVREKYRYVFVDEYQDVNPAQERVLSLLSGEEVFLVGDAKQSIYGFRGSRSEYFLRKCGEYRALALSENFRSSSAVLEAVNRVFSYAMTEKSAGIDYASSPMRGGSRFGAHEGGVFFHEVPSAEKEPSPPRGVYSVLKEAAKPVDEQARLVCRIIEEEVGSDWFDADAGCVKKLGFGDIAVLVRENGASTASMIAEMSERDIPVTAAAEENVCDFWEARLLIDWLSFLDNGEQDIPMAGAMLSRAGGFSEEELAEIRLRFPQTYAFRAACGKYRETVKDGIAEKLNTFAQKTEKYRAYMRVATAAETISLLLSEGLEAEIAAKRDGAVRLRRVRRLMAEADGSVNAFLRRLKALGYRVTYSEAGGENAVKVLTIHTAKGLEYPVVILPELSACFRGDERKEVICTDKFPFAPKSFDLKGRVVYDNVLRLASFLYEDRERVKGELNLLYVAMTRAKYRLHLLFRGRGEAIGPQYAERFADFFDFDDCARYFAPPPPPEKEAAPREALVYSADAELLEKLQTVYQKPYPYAQSALLPVKSSATELLQIGREERAAYRGVSGGATVEEGLAYHAFLQHVRFGERAREELARMERENLLSPAQLALLDAEKLQKILELPSVARLKGKEVLREQTFLVSLPANEIPALASPLGDELILQGALDLLCRDEEGYLILDYKYSAHDAARLKADYAAQIGLYRKAVAKIAGIDERTVRARIINICALFEVEM